MEQYLTRDEIVRRAKARLGFTTNASQAGLVQQEFEELARSAAMAVYAAHEWGSLKAEERAEIGIDQTVVDYPNGTTASDLIAVSVWDGDRYVSLAERFIPLSMTQSPKLDEGEPASIQDRSRPLYFDKRAQIVIAPRPDKIYELKLFFTRSADLATPSTVSVVDAELIILHVIADKRLAMGDTEMAIRANDQYEERLAILKRRSSSAHAVQRNDGYRARASARLGGSGYVPNSGSWPSVKPSA